MGMLGWLCADHIRIQSIEAQDAVLEGLIRECFRVVNPHSSLPEVSDNLKPHLLLSPTLSPTVPKGVASLSSLQNQKLSGLEEKDEHHGHDRNAKNEESSNISGLHGVDTNSK